MSFSVSESPAFIFDITFLFKSEMSSSLTFFLISLSFLEVLISISEFLSSDIICTSEFLFISKYGASKKRIYKHLARQQINEIVTKVSINSLSEYNLSNKKSGITKYKQISPHMFRHALGTHLHKSGIDIFRVRDHLGHSSVSTTSRYVGKEKKKMVILDKYGPLSKK